MCKLFVSFVLLISSVVIFGQTKPDIIPLPVEMEVNEAVFVIDENTSVRYNKTDEELQQVAGFLSQYIEDISGISLKHNKKSFLNWPMMPIYQMKGICPEGHPGEGNPTWLFVDEIIVE